jgi:pyrroline-5-carboxylate reductase
MRVGFIGAGNMAGALAGAIQSAQPNTEFVASDVSGEQLERFAAGLERATTVPDNRSVVDTAELTFLSVKPQVLDEVLPELAHTPALVVSIAAGVRIATLEAALTQARVVRVMPNTPGLVGEMAAGYAGGTRATAADVALVGRLLESAGVALPMDEELLDAVTGVSGSGPAFIARLIEAFTDAGAAHGLDRDVAYRLVLQTFAGTARLLYEKGLSPQGLVDMVSSKGGTTVAGRGVLEASDYADVIRRTVDATVARSRELGA